MINIQLRRPVPSGPAATLNVGHGWGLGTHVRTRTLASDESGSRTTLRGSGVGHSLNCMLRDWNRVLV